MPRIPLAISACLLGEAVRYDGGHKRDAGLVAALDAHVRWVPVCPEVLAGFGVPRPPIRVVRGEAGLGVREVAGGADRTEALAQAAAAVLARLRAEGVRGFVCKARSPSCGHGDADAFDADGALVGQGDGLVVAALREAMPDLWIASEAELADEAAREAFLARLRAT